MGSSLFSTSATAFFRVFRVLGAAFGFAGVLTALPERVFLTMLAKSKVYVKKISKNALHVSEVCTRGPHTDYQKAYLD